MKSLILLVASLCFGLLTYAQDCSFEAYENAIGGISIMAESDLVDAQYVWYVDGLLTFEGALIEPNNTLPEGTYNICVQAYNDDTECEYCDTVTISDIGGDDPYCEIEYGLNADDSVILFALTDMVGPTFEWYNAITGESYGDDSPITLFPDMSISELPVCLNITDMSGETCTSCLDIPINPDNDPYCFFEYEVDATGLITVYGVTDLDAANYTWVNDMGDIIGTDQSVSFIPPPNVEDVFLCMFVDNGIDAPCEYCELIPIENVNPTDCEVVFDYVLDAAGFIVLSATSDLDVANYDWSTDGAYLTSGEVVTVGTPAIGEFMNICVNAYDEINNITCEYCEDIPLDNGGGGTEPNCALTYEVNPNGILTFFGTSDLEIPSYEWILSNTGEIVGEGDVITFIPPPNTVEITVCMLVTDANGDVCEVCEDIPIDNGGTPIDTCWVAFDYEEIDGEVILYGSSSLEDPNYAWTVGFFGETGEIAVFPLGPGIYEVCLDASNSNDFCSYCGEIVVTGPGGGEDCVIYDIWVEDLDPMAYEYTLAVDYDISLLTDPLTYVWVIINLSTGEATTYTNDFPDVIFDGPGEYNIMVELTDANGVSCSYEVLVDIEDQGTAGCEIYISEGEEGTYFFEVQSTPIDFPSYAFNWSVDGVDIFVGEQNAMYQFEEGLHAVCVEVWLPNGDYYCDECIDIMVNIINPGDTLLVWPGDANNDGIANNEDLLNIGIAYGISGVEREEMGTDWQGYVAMPWDLYFINEINLAYADCNGDGTVNDDDFDAIDINYGETHGKTGSESEATADDPTIYVDLPEEELSDGDELIAPLMLGDANIGVEGFYGMAFTLEFDVEIFDPNSVEIQLEDSWLGNADELLSIQKAFPEEGRVEIAITRKNQINVDGAGPVANMIGIIDNIAGKQNELTEFTVEISNVRAIGNDEQEVLLNTIAETGYVEGGTTIESLDNKWSVYPNPTQGIALVDGLTEMAAIEVTDIQGRVVLRTVTDKVIDLSELDAGVYLLGITTEKGVQLEKIVLER